MGTKHNQRQHHVVMEHIPSFNGPAGTESPYGIYPLWVFSDEALAGQGANTVLYLSEGHEYDPPLFHGAHELAFDGNTGELLWSNLGFDDTGYRSRIRRHDDLQRIRRTNLRIRTRTKQNNNRRTFNRRNNKDTNNHQRHSHRHMRRRITTSSCSKLPERSAMRFRRIACPA